MTATGACFLALGSVIVFALMTWYAARCAEQRIDERERNDGLPLR